MSKTNQTDITAYQDSVWIFRHEKHGAAVPQHARDHPIMRIYRIVLEVPSWG